LIAPDYNLRGAQMLCDLPKVINESLLFWCLFPIVGWTVWALVIGIPIHLALGVRLSSIALFVAIQCAIHMAASPWLFLVRVSTVDSRWRMVSRARAVIAWLCLAYVAAVLQISDGDLTDRTGLTIFLSGPVFLGFCSWLGLRWFQRRADSNQAS
jgi:hypothetical protein